MPGDARERRAVPGLTLIRAAFAKTRFSRPHFTFAAVPDQTPRLPPLLECVANVSEGRDRTVIARLAGAIAQTPNVQLLHTDSGVDANRTVFTFVGPPDSVGEAALALAAEAIACIDLRDYDGTHPYIGALDVCPFVPLFGLPGSEALRIAEHVGQRLGERYRLPVYLYEQSATRPAYVSLAAVREGGLPAVAKRYREALSGDLGEGPDFGPEGVHPTAGASVVGARDILVAYNINLDTDDVRVARRIAKCIRASGNGRRLPGVRAIGWQQPTFSCAQVSVNLTDYRRTGMGEVFRAVTEEARALGHATAGSELIGLVPLVALVNVPPAFGEAMMSVAGSVARAVRVLGLDALAPFDARARVLEYAVADALGHAS